MHQRLLAVTLVGLLALTGSLAGCRTGQVESDNGEEFERVDNSQLPSDDAIPPGTELRVELEEKLSTQDTREGERFSARLVEPLVTVDGDTVVPSGAMVHGEVTGIVSSNSPDEQAAIRLHVQEISFDDATYEMPARIVQTDVKTDRDKSDIATGAAVGGVAGAALGAIIGQDAKGALIGGALGAGTGTIISLGYGRTDAELPAGSEMVLRTSRTVELRQ